MMKISLSGIAAILIAGLLGGCNQGQSTNEKNTGAQTDLEYSYEEGATDINYADVTEAVCVLHPTEGNKTHGTVTFTKTLDGVRVEANIMGLSAGKHGFHIHEKGDCTADDGTSAGGHFNPDEVEHGGPDDMERHVGDLGNIEADENGVGTLSYVDDRITFEGENSIIGRGIIVHAGEDDLTTQPTGAAGARLACGVIGIVETTK